MSRTVGKTGLLYVIASRLGYCLANNLFWHTIRIRTVCHHWNVSCAIAKSEHRVKIFFILALIHDNHDNWINLIGLWLSYYEDLAVQTFPSILTSRAKGERAPESIATPPSSRAHSITILLWQLGWINPINPTRILSHHTYDHLDGIALNWSYMLYLYRNMHDNMMIAWFIGPL